MGYTHYFTIENLEECFVDEVNAIVTTAQSDGIVLAGFDGNGEPIVTDTKIALNGSRALGQEYESFVLPTNGNGFGFCKTAHRPYDVVVTAILVSAIVNKIDDGISSDGTYADWKDGIALYERAVRKLTQSERKRIRRTLNHEFRTRTLTQLRNNGFDVRLTDADNGIYEITYADAPTQVAALGYAVTIAYDAIESKTGRYCRSLKLSELLGKFVKKDRENYYKRNGYYGKAFSWDEVLCYY